TEEAAELAGLLPSSFRSTLSRPSNAELREAAVMTDGRTPMYPESAVRAWIESRPGRGRWASSRSTEHDVALPSPAERLKRRKRAGLSRAEFAEELGVTATTMWRWEHGAAEPHGERRATYAEKLKALRSRR